MAGSMDVAACGLLVLYVWFVLAWMAAPPAIVYSHRSLVHHSLIQDKEVIITQPWYGAMLASSYMIMYDKKSHYYNVA